MAVVADPRGQRAAGQGNEYLIFRTYRSSMRLNFQHWLVTRLCGDRLVHSCVPVRKIHDDDKKEENTDKKEEEEGYYEIADVGAGTGLWAMETGASLRAGNNNDNDNDNDNKNKNVKIKVHGFDISSAQFPPASEAAQCGVELHTHDCFTPFAAQWRGRFDLVNVRFMLCLVNDPDIDTLLAQLVSLLKPGGYLQWFEPLPARTTVYRPAGVTAAQTRATAHIADMWRKPTPISSYRWIEALPQLYERHGLAVAAVETLPLPPPLRLPWAQASMATLDDSAGWNSEHLYEPAARATLFQSLQEEMALGVAMHSVFTWAVGTKKKM